MSPEPSATSEAMLGRRICCQRLRRLTPTTICVALTPRAWSRIASATSGPETFWNSAPRSPASLRRRASAAGSVEASPSADWTWQAMRSPPAARVAMRAPRRSSVSLPAPPVSATTTRSRAGHWSLMPWSAR